MPLITPVQLRFSDIDVLGHVNNTIYFSLMDLGKTRYFAEVAGPDLDISRMGLVVVNVNCDFMAPAFFDERLEVVTRCIHIGDKSLTLEQTVVCPDKGKEDGGVKCRCRSVMCGFSAATMQSMEIPDEWRTAIHALEGDIE